LIKNADQLLMDQKNGVTPAQSCTNLGLLCAPTVAPTKVPTASPTGAPTPTVTPTTVPTVTPTPFPTAPPPPRTMKYMV
jgi:hypothetical protein